MIRNSKLKVPSPVVRLPPKKTAALFPVAKIVETKSKPRSKLPLKQSTSCRNHTVPDQTAQAHLRNPRDANLKNASLTPLSSKANPTSTPLPESHRKARSVIPVAAPKKTAGKPGPGRPGFKYSDANLSKYKPTEYYAQVEAYVEEIKLEKHLQVGGERDRLPRKVEEKAVKVVKAIPDKIEIADEQQEQIPVPSSQPKDLSPTAQQNIDEPDTNNAPEEMHPDANIDDIPAEGDHVVISEDTTAKIPRTVTLLDVDAFIKSQRAKLAYARFGGLSGEPTLIGIGTEILNQEEQLFIRQNRTSLLERCLSTVKFDPSLLIKCQIFADLENSPVLTVTQSRSQIGKHFVGYENLKFVVKSSTSAAVVEESIALVVNCMECTAIDCCLHSAEIFVPDGGDDISKLGSCEYLTCDPSSTSLLLKNIITTEAFILRYSKECEFKVFQRFDLNDPDDFTDPLDDQKDGSVIAAISSLKFPKECLSLTFTEKLNSLSKALILGGTLLINYDLLKNH